MEDLFFGKEDPFSMAKKVNSKDIKTNLGQLDLTSRLTGNVFDEDTPSYVSYLNDPKNIKYMKGDDQTFFNALGNSLAGGTLSGLITATESFKSIYDFTIGLAVKDLSDRDSLDEWLHKTKQSLDEKFPIYEETKDKSDFSDPASYFIGVKAIIDSTIGYLPYGMVTGKAVGALAKYLTTYSKINKLKRLEELNKTVLKTSEIEGVVKKSEEFLKIGNELGNINTMSNVASLIVEGVLTNVNEGKAVGFETYDKVMAYLDDDPNLSQEAKENLAKKAMMRSFYTNMFFIASDVFLAKYYIKSGLLGSRSFKNLSGLKEFGKAVGSQSFQEYSQALTTDYHTIGVGKEIGYYKDFNKSFTDPDNIFEGVIGGITGVGFTALGKLTASKSEKRKYKSTKEYLYDSFEDDVLSNLNSHIESINKEVKRIENSALNDKAKEALIKSLSDKVIVSFAYNLYNKGLGKYLDKFLEAHKLELENQLKSIDSVKKDETQDNNVEGKNENDSKSKDEIENELKNLKLFTESLHQSEDYFNVASQYVNSKDIFLNLLNIKKLSYDTEAVKEVISINKSEDLDSSKKGQVLNQIKKDKDLKGLVNELEDGLSFEEALGENENIDNENNKKRLKELEDKNKTSELTDEEVKELKDIKNKLNERLKLKDKYDNQLKLLEENSFYFLDLKNLNDILNKKMKLLKEELKNYSYNLTQEAQEKYVAKAKKDLEEKLKEKIAKAVRNKENDDKSDDPNKPKPDNPNNNPDNKDKDNLPFSLLLEELGASQVSVEDQHSGSKNKPNPKPKPKKDDELKKNPDESNPDELNNPDKSNEDNKTENKLKKDENNEKDEKNEKNEEDEDIYGTPKREINPDAPEEVFSPTIIEDEENKEEDDDVLSPEIKDDENAIERGVFNFTTISEFFVGNIDEMDSSIGDTLIISITNIEDYLSIYSEEQAVFHLKRNDSEIDNIKIVIKDSSGKIFYVIPIKEAFNNKTIARLVEDYIEYLANTGNKEVKLSIVDNEIYFNRNNEEPELLSELIDEDSKAEIGSIDYLSRLIASDDRIVIADKSLEGRVFGAGVPILLTPLNDSDVYTGTVVQNILLNNEHPVYRLVYGLIHFNNKLRKEQEITPSEKESYDKLLNFSKKGKPPVNYNEFTLINDLLITVLKTFFKLNDLNGNTSNIRSNSNPISFHIDYTTNNIYYTLKNSNDLYLLEDINKDKLKSLLLTSRLSYSLDKSVKLPISVKNNKLVIDFEKNSTYGDIYLHLLQTRKNIDNREGKNGKIATTVNNKKISLKFPKLEKTTISDLFISLEDEEGNNAVYNENDSTEENNSAEVIEKTSNNSTETTEKTSDNENKESKEKEKETTENTSEKENKDINDEPEIKEEEDIPDESSIKNIIDDLIKFSQLNEEIGELNIDYELKQLAIIIANRIIDNSINHILGKYNIYKLFKYKSYSDKIFNIIFDIYINDIYKFNDNVKENLLNNKEYRDIIKNRVLKELSFKVPSISKNNIEELIKLVKSLEETDLNDDIQSNLENEILERYNEDHSYKVDRLTKLNSFIITFLLGIKKYNNSGVKHFNDLGEETFTLDEIKAILMDVGTKINPNITLIDFEKLLRKVPKLIGLVEKYESLSVAERNVFFIGFKHAFLTKDIKPLGFRLYKNNALPKEYNTRGIDIEANDTLKLAILDNILLEEDGKYSRSKLIGLLNKLHNEGDDQILNGKLDIDEALEYLSEDSAKELNKIIEYLGGKDKVTLYRLYNETIRNLNSTEQINKLESELESYLTHKGVVIVNNKIKKLTKKFNIVFTEILGLTPDLTKELITIIARNKNYINQFNKLTKYLSNERLANSKMYGSKQDFLYSLPKDLKSFIVKIISKSVSNKYDKRTFYQGTNLYSSVKSHNHITSTESIFKNLTENQKSVYERIFGVRAFNHFINLFNSGIKSGFKYMPEIPLSKSGFSKEYKNYNKKDLAFIQFLYYLKYNEFISPQIEKNKTKYLFNITNLSDHKNKDGVLDGNAVGDILLNDILLHELSYYIKLTRTTGNTGRFISYEFNSTAINNFINDNIEALTSYAKTDENESNQIENEKILIELKSMLVDYFHSNEFSQAESIYSQYGIHSNDDNVKLDPNVNKVLRPYSKNIDNKFYEYVLGSFVNRFLFQHYFVYPSLSVDTNKVNRDNITKRNKTFDSSGDNNHNREVKVAFFDDSEFETQNDGHVYNTEKYYIETLLINKALDPESYMKYMDAWDRHYFFLNKKRELAIKEYKTIKDKDSISIEDFIYTKLLDFHKKNRPNAEHFFGKLDYHITKETLSGFTVEGVFINSKNAGTVMSLFNSGSGGELNNIRNYLEIMGIDILISKSSTKFDSGAVEYLSLDDIKQRKLNNNFSFNGVKSVFTTGVNSLRTLLYNASQKSNKINLSVQALGGITSSIFNTNLGSDVQNELKSVLFDFYKNNFDNLIKDLDNNSYKILNEISNILDLSNIPLDEQNAILYNMAKYIKTSDNGSLLEIISSPLMSKIAPVLVKYFNKKVLDIRLEGNNYELASTLFIEDIINSNEYIAVDRNFDGNLKEYINEKGVKVAQAIVPLPINSKITDFIKVDKETGKKYVDLDKIPKEYFMAYGVRVPYSFHSSGGAIEIVGFMPSNQHYNLVAGELIMRTGGDYDNDRKFIYYKKLKKVKNETDDTISIEIDKNDISTKLVNLFLKVREEYSKDNKLASILDKKVSIDSYIAVRDMYMDESSENISLSGINYQLDATRSSSNSSVLIGIYSNLIQAINMLEQMDVNLNSRVSKVKFLNKLGEFKIDDKVFEAAQELQNAVLDDNKWSITKNINLNLTNYLAKMGSILLGFDAKISHLFKQNSIVNISENSESSILDDTIKNTVIAIKDENNRLLNKLYESSKGVKLRYKDNNEVEDSMAKDLNEFKSNFIKNELQYYIDKAGSLTEEELVDLSKNYDENNLEQVKLQIAFVELFNRLTLVGGSINNYFNSEVVYISKKLRELKKRFNTNSSTSVLDITGDPTIANLIKSFVNEYYSTVLSDITGDNLFISIFEDIMDRQAYIRNLNYKNSIITKVNNYTKSLINLLAYKQYKNIKNNKDKISNLNNIINNIDFNKTNNLFLTLLNKRLSIDKGGLDLDIIKRSFNSLNDSDLVIEYSNHTIERELKTITGKELFTLIVENSIITGSNISSFNIFSLLDNKGKKEFFDYSKVNMESIISSISNKLISNDPNFIPTYSSDKLNEYKRDLYEEKNGIKDRYDEVIIHNGVIKQLTFSPDNGGIRNTNKKVNKYISFTELFAPEYYNTKNNNDNSSKDNTLNVNNTNDDISNTSAKKENSDSEIPTFDPNVFIFPDNNENNNDNSNTNKDSSTNNEIENKAENDDDNDNSGTNRDSNYKTEDNPFSPVINDDNDEENPFSPVIDEGKNQFEGKKPVTEIEGDSFTLLSILDSIGENNVFTIQLNEFTQLISTSDILGNSVSEKNIPFKAIIELLKAISKKFPSLKVTIINDKNLNFRGRYNKKSEVIELNLAYISGNNVKFLSTVISTIHEEILHSFTYNELLQQKESYKNITKIYKQVLDHFRSIDPEFDNKVKKVRQKIKDRKSLTTEDAFYYALSDIHEFVAWAFKNEKLINYLQSKNVSKSIIQKLIDSLKAFIKDINKLLGIEDNTLLNELYLNVFDLVLTDNNDNNVNNFLKQVSNENNQEPDDVNTFLGQVSKQPEEQAPNDENSEFERQLPSSFSLANLNLDFKTNYNEAIDNIISNFTIYIHKLQNMLNDIAKEGYNEDNSARLFNINNQINLLKKKVKEIQELRKKNDNTNRVKLLLEYLMNHAKLLTNNRMDDVELNYVSDIITFINSIVTLNTDENFIIKFSSNKTEDNSKIDEQKELISNTFGSLYEDLYRVSADLEQVKRNKAKKLVKEIFNNNSTELNDDSIFKAYNDTGTIKAYALDISRISNPLVETIFNIIKKVTSKIKIEMNIAFKDMEDKEREFLKKHSLKELIDIIRQKDGKGNYTEYLLNPFSYSFINKFKSMSLNNKIKFFKNNIQIIPLSLVADEGDIEVKTKVNKDKIYKELLDKFDNDKELLDLFIDEAKYKYLQYKSKRDLYISQVNNSLIEKSLLNDWLNENSIFLLEKELKNELDVVTPKLKQLFNAGIKNLSYLPNKKDSDGNNTNYYDNNYKSVMSDKSKKDFYNYYRESLIKYNNYLKVAGSTRSSIEESFGLYQLRGGNKGILSSFKTAEGRISLSSALNAVSDIKERALRDKKQKTNITSSIDPITRQRLNKFNISVGDNMSSLVQERYEYLVAKYMADNKVESLTETIRINLRSEALKYINHKFNFDPISSLKHVAMSGINLKYKYLIKDTVELLRNELRKMSVKDTNIQGEQLNKNGLDLENRSISKTLQAVEFYVNNVFYNETSNKESSGKKKIRLNKRELLLKKEIEESLKKLHDKLKKELNDKNKKEIVNSINILNKKLDSLGSSSSLDKKGKLLLRYYRALSLSFNGLAGIVNSFIGKMNNYLEASTDKEISILNLDKAYSVLKKSFINKESKALINLLMRDLDILKRSSDEFVTRSNSDTSFKRRYKKALSYFGLYSIQNNTEWMNQAALLIAKMYSIKVKSNKTGKDVSLFEALDTKTGLLKDEFNNVDNNKIWSSKSLIDDSVVNFKMAMDNMIARNHGNYDYDRATLMSSKVSLMLTAQFRKWMFELFNTRWGDRKETVYLENGATKGRYWSFVDSILNEKMPVMDRVKFLTANLSKQFTRIIFAQLKIISLGNLDSNLNQDYTKYKGKDTGLSELDSGNIKAVVSELTYLIELILVNAMFVLLLSGEDDDDENKLDVYAINLSINMLLRLKQDLVFFTNPFEAVNLISNIIPSFNLIKRIERVTDNIYENVFESTDKSINKLFNSSVKLIPGASSVQSVIKTSENLYQPKSILNNLLTDE